MEAGAWRLSEAAPFHRPTGTRPELVTDDPRTLATGRRA